MGTIMATTGHLDAVAATPRSRMRTIIVDADLQRCELIRRAVLADPAYDLAGQAGTQQECAELIAHEIPELAICAANMLPSILPDEPFPLVIGIGRSSAWEPQRLVCDIPEIPCASHLARALAIAGSRILATKAGDLSRLIHRYLAHGGNQPEGFDRIMVDHQGQRISLSPEDILWIESEGNYVHLHAVSGNFILRSPISSIGARLAPFGFARIHRCVLVNTAVIGTRKALNGRLTSIVLRDGTHLQVGPKFRDSLPSEDQRIVQ